MFRLTSQQPQPIGVDIGAEGVKLLQVQATGEHLSLVASARQAYTEPASDPILRIAQAVDLVRRLIGEHPFVGRRIVAALPREIVHVKNLRLPMIPGAELEGAVKFEARNVFPFDVDQCQIRFLPAGEVRQGTEVRQELIVLAVKNDDISAFLEQLNRANVNVASLDFEPSALFRGVERFIRRKDDEQEAHVLVDVGSRGTQVVIGKGRDINFIKTVDIGCAHFHDLIARKVGISLDEAKALRERLIQAQESGDPGTGDARRESVRQAVVDATRSTMEELAREISLCLRYYSVTFRGYRPNRVRLFGGGANDPYLQGVLRAVLPIPLEQGRPLHNVGPGRSEPAGPRGPMTEWAVALGLSLRTTTLRFAARDGRPRGATDPTATGSAVVVDLEKAVRSADDSAPAETNAPTKREVAHA